MPSDYVNFELAAPVIKMYNDLNVLLQRIVPGSSIELIIGENGPENVIKTPSTIVRCVSNTLPGILTEMFTADTFHLSGEHTLLQVIEFAEKHGSIYFNFKKHQGFVEIWHVVTTQLQRCRDATKLKAFYQTIYTDIFNMIQNASKNASLSVKNKSGDASLWIYTPNMVLESDYPLAVLSLLSYTKPQGEDALIGCIKLSTRFAEMTNALAKIINSNRMFVDVNKEQIVYH